MPYAYAQHNVNRQKSSAFCCVLVTGCMLLLAMLALIWVMPNVVQPYNKFHENRVDQVIRARNFVEKPGSICKSQTLEALEYRVAIGDLDKCHDNEKLMNSNPDYDAFVDLMAHLNWCPSGSCFYSQVSMFGYISVMVYGCIVLFAIIAACFLSCLGLWCYQSARASGILPTTFANDPVEDAVRMKRDFATPRVVVLADASSNQNCKQRGYQSVDLGIYQDMNNPYAQYSGKDQ